jgi:hypothetical protein
MALCGILSSGLSGHKANVAITFSPAPGHKERTGVPPFLLQTHPQKVKEDLNWVSSNTLREDRSTEE